MTVCGMCTIISTWGIREKPSPKNPQLAEMNLMNMQLEVTKGLLQHGLTAGSIGNLPLKVTQRKGEDLVFTKDEGIKPDSDIETLSQLRPVFNKEGQVTAGNASTLNDGASAILMTSESTAEENGWEVIAYVEDYCTSGVEPHRVMSAPIPAIQTLLDRNSLSVLDVDIYEHNEAFASASCAIAKELGIPHNRFNLHGGAISLGHPLGSSGTRCLISLLGVLRRTDGNSGIVTLCLGGGNAVAMLVRIP